MNIEIRFFGSVSKAADNLESTGVSFDGETLGELLDLIMERWPGTKEFITGAHSSTMLFALNNKALEPPDLSMKMTDGDKLAIMPLVAGG
jgi:molybdopterin converting factor small subunit